MSVHLGADFHARTQTVCSCDTADGVIHQRRLDHQGEDVHGFYAQFAAPAVVGLEATSYARWFHRPVEETGHCFLVGDAYAIRKCARRRQKNDRRDAELLLDLHLHGEFPAVHVPSPSSKEALRLSRCRHRLVADPHEAAQRGASGGVEPPVRMRAPVVERAVRLGALLEGVSVEESLRGYEVAPAPLNRPSSRQQWPRTSSRQQNSVENHRPKSESPCRRASGPSAPD